MRPDYCPVANEPCQCVCLDGCRIKNNSRKPLTDEQFELINKAWKAVGAEIKGLVWSDFVEEINLHKAHDITGEKK